MTEEGINNSIREHEVSLNLLAKLTGFPSDFIKKELLLCSEVEKISLSKLRLLMSEYLNRTMLSL